MDRMLRTIPLTLLVALCGAHTRVLAQVRPLPAVVDSTRLAAAKQLLDAMGAVDLLLGGMKASLPGARMALPQLPQEYWTRLQDSISRAAPEVLDSLALLYADTYSLEELHQLTAFWESPIGQKVRATQPQLVSDAAAFARRWGARVGYAIGASLGLN